MMNLKLTRFILLISTFFSTCAFSQWTIIDTMYTASYCQSPQQYEAKTQLLNSDTSYYYFNTQACSPSGNPAYGLKKTTNSFNTWNTIKNESYANMSLIKFINGNIGYIVKNVFGSETFQKTIDGGLTWSVLNSSASNNSGVYDLFIFNQDSGYAISKLGVFQKFLFDTLTFVADVNFTPAYNPAIHFINSNIGFILANNDIQNTYSSNKLLRTSDGGQTWNSIFSDSSTQFNDMAFLNDSVGFISSNLGLYKTTDTGISWTLINAFNTSCVDVATLNNSLVYAISYNAIYVSYNSGNAWTTQILPSNFFPNKITLLSDTLGYLNGYLFGQYNVIAKSNLISLNPATLPSNDALENTICYPNPSNNILYVDLPDKKNTNSYSLILSNSMGEVFINETRIVQSGKMELNLRHLASGIYFLELSDQNNNLIKKRILKI